MLAAMLLCLSTAPIAGASSFVGFRIHTFAYQLPDGGFKWLTVGIWYPTKKTPKAYDYPYVTGRVRVNAAVNAPERLPLVVHSHGHSECGVASAYLHERLAAEGYIVVAPDHEDAANCRILGGTAEKDEWNPWKTTLENVPHRPYDITAVIDEMVRLDAARGTPFFRRIDTTRIAASGHSIGAWTVAAVSGGIPALEDARIGATLLWSPPYLQPSSLYEFAQAPVMHLYGMNEAAFLSPAARDYTFMHSAAPKMLGYIGDVGHYAFTNFVCAFYGSTDACVAINPAARSTVELSLAFLDGFVRDDAAARWRLAALLLTLPYHRVGLF